MARDEDRCFVPMRADLGPYALRRRIRGEGIGDADVARVAEFVRGDLSGLKGALEWARKDQSRSDAGFPRSLENFAQLLAAVVGKAAVGIAAAGGVIFGDRVAEEVEFHE